MLTFKIKNVVETLQLIVNLPFSLKPYFEQNYSYYVNWMLIYTRHQNFSFSF